MADFSLGSLFELTALAWGYIFVIVVAGCSLIIAYYHKKGKLVVRSPFGKPEKNPQEENKKEEGEDSKDE